MIMLDWKTILMNEPFLLAYKVLNIIIYGLFYIYLYKKLNRVEEKILYWNFLVLFFIGGSFSALIFNYTSSVFSSSGMLNIQTGFISWSIYFIIVFLLPLLSIILTNKIFIAIPSKNTGFKGINLIIIYCMLIFIFIFIFINIDLNNLIFNYNYKGYAESLLNRYNLQYTFIFVFIVKVLTFILLLALSIEYFYRERRKLSFALFIAGVVIYGVIDNLIFISKLYFVGFAFSYIVFLLINLKKKYFIVIASSLAVAYILFYFYNVGSNYEANYIEPILKGITRFTISVPYYIEYYMNNNFNMKIYFHSILIGENIISPNIKVFSTMFDDSHMQVQGSLASSIFTYNYANFGIFTIVKSLFEILILISLYAYITKNGISSIKLAIFFLLVFGIINYSFITIMVGPLLGIVFFILFYISIKNIKIIINNKGKQLNETTITRP